MEGEGDVRSGLDFALEMPLMSGYGRDIYFPLGNVHVQSSSLACASTSIQAFSAKLAAANYTAAFKQVHDGQIAIWVGQSSGCVLLLAVSGAVS